MREMGDAVMGSGVATGENRAVEAAHAAISSPLLEDVSISGAQGVLVNITGGSQMSLVEIDEATEIIHEAAGEEANVILGAVVDEDMTDEIMVTVIATGFNRRGFTGAGSKPKIPVMERIPAGLSDLKSLDPPAAIRRGLDITINRPGTRDLQEQVREKIDKADPEKPAFLRKIMD